MKLLISLLMLLPFHSQAQCLFSRSIQKKECEKGKLNLVKNPESTNGLYQLYRLLKSGNQHRQCRLQPTCSLFLVQATEGQGMTGLIWGLARMQMEHDDQGGYLHPVVASDGEFIYDDPISNWEDH